MTQARHGRRGAVFSVRVTDEERAQLEALQRQGGGPRSLGAWMRWRALTSDPVVPGQLPPPTGRVLPARAAQVLPAWAETQRGPGSTAAVSSSGSTAPAVVDEVLPCRGTGAGAGTTLAIAERVILDLCGGSGSWSAPYARAGYRVELVTLPDRDVRTYVPPARVWGVVAAPPCTEFSLARNGTRSRRPSRTVMVAPRDLIAGMECVNACLRIIMQCRPRWWALENPVGLLSEFLGVPRDTWEPCDFGDPWTKRTAIWGDYQIPARGPFVEPLGGGPFCAVCPSTRKSTWCSNAAHRAITPPGFARAFHEANP